MMLQPKTILFLTGLIVIIGLSVFVWWAWTVEIITINSHSQPSETTLTAVTTCTDKLRGSYYLLLSRSQLEYTIEHCDDFVDSVSVSYAMPREVVFDITFFTPYAKVIVGDHCLLYGKNRNIVVPIDRCLEIIAPIVTGLDSLSNEPLNQYISQVINAFKEHAIPFSSMEYIAQGGSSWLGIQLDETHKSLIGINADVDEKVRTLQAAIKGLKEAKEPYAIIDLRFDRVVYK